MKRFVDVVMRQDCGVYEKGQHYRLTFAAAQALVESKKARFGVKSNQPPPKTNPFIEAVLERNNFNEMRTTLARMVTYSTAGMKKDEIRKRLNAEKYRR
jgi:hypothetical protein